MAYGYRNHFGSSCKRVSQEIRKPLVRVSTSATIVAKMVAELGSENSAAATAIPDEDGQSIGEEMQVMVKTLMGSTITIDMTTEDTTLEAKKKIELKVGTLPEQQILTFKGKQLEDGRV